MRSASDPIRTLWLRSVVVTGVGLIACVATGVWAFGPLELRDIEIGWTPQIQSAVEPKDQDDASRQMAVFEKQLWTPPVLVEPETTTQLVEARPPPPLKLVLIGIVTPDDSASAGYEAILYDPDTDTTHIVRTGETIGKHSIGTVTAESAELQTDSRTVELTLDTGREAGRG